MYVFVFDAFWAGGLAFLDACTRKEKDIYSCKLYVAGFNLPFSHVFSLMVAMTGV